MTLFAWRSGQLVNAFTNSSELSLAGDGRVQTRRRWVSASTMARVAPVRKMIVAKTNTWGGIPTRVEPKTHVGNTVAGPWVNWLITKSSIDRANASKNPARIPGNSSGSVTLKNAVTGVAPS